MHSMNNIYHQQLSATMKETQNQAFQLQGPRPSTALAPFNANAHQGPGYMSHEPNRYGYVPSQPYGIHEPPYNNVNANAHPGTLTQSHNPFNSYAYGPPEPQFASNPPLPISIPQPLPNSAPLPPQGPLAVNANTVNHAYNEPVLFSASQMNNANAAVPGVQVTGAGAGVPFFGVGGGDPSVASQFNDPQFHAAAAGGPTNQLQYQSAGFNGANGAGESGLHTTIANQQPLGPPNENIELNQILARMQYQALQNENRPQVQAQIQTRNRDELGPDPFTVRYPVHLAGQAYERERAWALQASNREKRQGRQRAQAKLNSRFQQNAVSNWRHRSRGRSGNVNVGDSTRFHHGPGGSGSGGIMGKESSRKRMDWFESRLAKHQAQVQQRQADEQAGVPFPFPFVNVPMQAGSENPSFQVSNVPSNTQSGGGVVAGFPDWNTNVITRDEDGWIGEIDSEQNKPSDTGNTAVLPNEEGWIGETEQVEQKLTDGDVTEIPTERETKAEYTVAHEGTSKQPPQQFHPLFRAQVEPEDKKLAWKAQKAREVFEQYQNVILTRKQPLEENKKVNGGGSGHNGQWNNSTNQWQGRHLTRSGGEQWHQSQGPSLQKPTQSVTTFPNTSPNFFNGTRTRSNTLESNLSSASASTFSSSFSSNFDPYRGNDNVGAPGYPIKIHTTPMSQNNNQNGFGRSQGYYYSQTPVPQNGAPHPYTHGQSYPYNGQSYGQTQAPGSFSPSYSGTPHFSPSSHHSSTHSSYQTTSNIYAVPDPHPEDCSCSDCHWIALLRCQNPLTEETIREIDEKCGGYGTLVRLAYQKGLLPPRPQAGKATKK